MRGNPASRFSLPAARVVILSQLWSMYVFSLFLNFFHDFESFDQTCLRLLQVPFDVNDQADRLQSPDGRLPMTILFDTQTEKISIYTGAQSLIDGLKERV